MKTASRQTIAAFVFAVASAHAASAQSAGGSDMAKRTFQTAEQLMREGKHDQALKDYQQIIQAFPDSPFADDAILKIGAFHYPPESIGELGTIGGGAQERARPLFEQVRERYPQSDSAPHALYKIGLLSMEPDSPKRDLDAASASFSRVVNIYPESDWVAHALLGAGTAEVGKRNYDRAILSLERGLEEAPHGAAAAETYYFLGVANARLGDFVRGAEAFQACRLEGAKSAAAARALNWLTLLYTMRLRSASGAAIEFNHDGTFVPRLPAGEDLRGELALAVSPVGELLVADAKRGAVLAFQEDGALLRTEPFEGVRRIGLDAFGRAALASAGEVRFGNDAFQAGRKVGNTVRRIEDIGGAWRSMTKDVYILDLKEGEILQYGTDPSEPKMIHRDKDAGTRTEAMVAGPEERLYLLDTKGKAVLVLEAGKVRPLAAPGAGPALEDPAAIAVNALGDVYIADAKLKAVIIVGADGRKLARISPPAGTLAEIAAPRALAVGPRGEVYIYDERKRTILRFR